MHWVVFPWRSTDVLTAKLAGSWEEKSPTGCCGSTADPVDRRFFCGSNNSSTSRKHANNWGNSSCCNPCNFFDRWQAKTSSPSDCYLQATSSKPNDSALADLMEKKLSRSIEQIEKIVSQLLKETPKATQPSKVAVQRRTLMSMRWAEPCLAQQWFSSICCFLSS